MFKLNYYLFVAFISASNLVYNNISFDTNPPVEVCACTDVNPPVEIGLAPADVNPPVE